jgi:hypothetical protein
MSQDNPGKKIIVDEDWKAEAEREKEALSAKLEEEKTKQINLPPMPEASFEVLLSSLATPAMLSLGLVQVPNRQVNLEEAKFYIDLLGVVEQKTKGNLETREHNLLTSMLYELRMAYVAMTKNPQGTE